MLSLSETVGLTRTDILLTLAVTALGLLGISWGWSTLAELPLVPSWQFTWETLGLGVGLGLGINGISSLAYRLWPGFQETSDEYLSLVLKPLRPGDILWLGLLPGLSEELLFRGVVLSTLGLAGSSILFGILHLMGIRHWPYALWAMVIGFVLGGAMLWTGNILIPILAHIVNNWLAGWLWYRRMGY